MLNNWSIILGVDTMQIKELQPRMGNVDIVLDIVEVENPREFSKFGKSGRVANAKAVDSTGQIKLSLWNEQIDAVKPGIKVHITNGYVSEWQGELQLTTGKLGKLEVIGTATNTEGFLPKTTDATTNTVKKEQKTDGPDSEELDDVEEDLLDDDY